MGKYFDEKLVEQYPNKYGWTFKNIATAKVLDWTNLRRYTTEYHYNGERDENKPVSWDGYSHIEGCAVGGEPRDYVADENEFFIKFAFNGMNTYYFTSYEGMCGYEFEKFYDPAGIENEFDMKVQVNAIRYLNMLVDNNIISPPDCRLFTIKTVFVTEDGPDETGILMAAPPSITDWMFNDEMKRAHDVLNNIASFCDVLEADDPRCKGCTDTYCPIALGDPYAEEGCNIETLLNFMKNSYKPTAHKIAYKIIDNAVYFD